MASTSEDDYGADGVIDGRTIYAAPTIRRATSSNQSPSLTTTSMELSTSDTTYSATYDKQGNPLHGGRRV